MEAFLDLVRVLKLGAAMMYIPEKRVVKVFLEHNDLETIVDVSEAICAVFGVSRGDIWVESSNSKGWKVVIAFEHDLEFGKTEEASEEKKEEAESKADLKYYVDDDGNLRIFKKTASFTLDYEKVKHLFEELPEKVTVKDALKIAEDVGLEIDYPKMLILFDFFDSNVNFDAKVVKEGKTKYLVKENFSLRDENRRKLMVEGEVIGKPWEV